MRYLILFLSFISLIFIPFSGHNTGRIGLALNWNINLPDDSSAIYYTDSGSSFHGDGVRYGVYKCDIPSQFKWTAYATDSPQEEYFTAFLTSCYDTLNVPDEQQASLSKCLYNYRVKSDNSELLLLYNLDKSLLYSVEYIR